MSVSRIALTLLLLGATAGTLSGQGPEGPVQDPPEAGSPAAPQAPAEPLPPVESADPQGIDQPVDQPQDFQIRSYRPVFRLGTPFALGPGADVGDAVVVMADATIEGRVNGDLVVVLGNVRLGSAAVVEGSMVIVGGVATVASGALVTDELVIVGGALEAPAGFVPGGEHVIIGPPVVGEGMRSIVPWFTRGLLWGRVIVPSLPWVWWIVAISLLMNIALALAFPRAVRACADTLSARPLGAFFVGMLTLLLIGPVSTILAISVVGVVVIPFALCAVVVGWVLGKVAVARWIGAGIVDQDEPDSRNQTLRSLLIGFAVLCVAYMIPLLGLATWALVGVAGLGTATLTLIAGLKSERPEPPPRPIAPAATPAPPSSPMAGPAAPDLASPDEVPGAPVLSASASDQRAEPPVPPAPPASGAAAGTDLTAFPRAAFLDRLAAAVLDLLLVLIAYNLLSFRHEEGVFFVLLLGYHVAFWAWKGTTVGGIICNLRLVRTDGSPLRPADALVRGLASLFSVAALGLGFLWILRDPDRQAWHDKIAGTYVVTVPRNWPLP